MVSPVYTDDLDDINKTIVTAIKENISTINLECRCKCKDGTYKLISWNVSVLLDENLVYSVGHDITEKKIMQDALISNQAYLKEVQQIANMGS